MIESIAMQEKNEDLVCTPFVFHQQEFARTSVLVDRVTPYDLNRCRATR